MPRSPRSISTRCFAIAKGVIAVDCRIRVRATTASAQSRLAIRPYPQQLETMIRTSEGQSYAVRPIKPEDEPALRRFADEVDSGDLWHAFFAPLRERTHETAARLSQIDYDREMTMLAWEGERVAGLARSTADPNFEKSECAVIIRADLREKGLARQLLQALVARHCDAGRPRGRAQFSGRSDANAQSQRGAWLRGGSFFV